jgi:uncharacterized protein YjdB
MEWRIMSRERGRQPQQQARVIMMRSKSVVALLFVALAACSKETVDPAAEVVEAVVVSPSITTIAIGASVNFTAQVMGLNGTALTDRPVHWATEDSSVATVAPNGIVSARRIGSTQVAASTGGRSGIAQITVTSIPVASVQVTPGNRSLFVEQTFQFTATTLDGGGAVLTGRPIQWSSNNESVATVSTTGVVTALSPGGAIITATSEGKTAPASVTVAAIPVATVFVTPDSQTLYEGQTAQLQAEPLDDAGQPLVDRVVQWTTTNPAVATVTSTGFVTAHTIGKATIRATVEGKVGATELTVGPRPPNAVVVTPAQVLVQPGKTAQLSVQVLDNLGREIPNSPVTWSSSDATIATVAADGLVTGVTNGEATITATSGGKTGTAHVTVTPTPVDNVVVTPSSPTILIGATVALSAAPYSSTGELLTGRSLTWSSGTPSVADVSSSGVVTALSAGSTVIFASVDGVLGWTTVVVVATPVASVTVTPPSATVAVAGTTPYSAVLHDGSGNVLTGRVIAWTTSNAAIATIDASGVATGVAPGTATITATSEGQSATASIVVSTRTVQIVPDSLTLPPFSTTTLTLIVTDQNGVVTNPNVTWSSSNSLVASVTQKGKVSTFLAGVAIITARVGNASGTATVVVK